MNDFWNGILLRITVSIILLITFLFSAIIYVSQLAKENSITLIQGVLVFMISILTALLLIGIIWLSWKSKLKKQKSHSHAKDFHSQKPERCRMVDE